MAFRMAQPTIPRGLMHTMYDLKAGSKFDQAQGGQWVPGGATERTPFQGAVLPVSDKDLVREITGTMSDHSEKIYTNGYALRVGAQVLDPQTNITYTVTQELGHNSIHPMKRYLVEARGEAATK
jgi:hypothetical protein|nr:MAG TPA: hypothetical protein [Caudoviricetes sp.]